VIIEERNERYTMMLFLLPEVDLLASASTSENRFLSLLRSKPLFQPAMLRPTKATMTALFLTCSIVYDDSNEKRIMKKEVFFIEKTHCKVSQCDSCWFRTT